MLKQEKDRLIRGIEKSKFLAIFDACVLFGIIIIVILLVLGFFPSEDSYRLAVAGFRSRISLAYALAWGTAILLGIDLLVTIFRHEDFHAGELRFQDYRDPIKIDVRALLYQGFGAAGDISLIIAWLAYFARGATLFQGTEIMGTITLSPNEYAAYILVNAIFSFVIGFMTIFLITTHWMSVKRFYEELMPARTEPEKKEPKKEMSQDFILIDGKRVPIAFSSSQPVYRSIEERKNKKIAELELRREAVFEEVQKQFTKNLEDKKRELIAKKRDEEQKQLQRDTKLNKIRQEIELKKLIQDELQKQTEKKPPAEKSRQDKYDFT